MISSQRPWPLDHEAGLNINISTIAFVVVFVVVAPVVVVLVCAMYHKEFCNQRQLFSWQTWYQKTNVSLLLISHQQPTLFFHYWAVGTSVGYVTYYKLFLPLHYLPFHQHSIKAKRGGREMKKATIPLLQQPPGHPQSLHPPVKSQLKYFSFSLEWGLPLPFSIH